MKISATIFLALATICAVSCEVFFEEKFLDGEFKCWWVKLMSRLLSGPVWTSIIENTVDWLHILSHELIGFFSNPLDSWEKNWVYSKHEGKEFGKFELTAGKFFNEESADKGN